MNTAHQSYGYDAGPTLTHHLFNMPCSLGRPGCKMYSDKTNVDMNQSGALVYCWYIVENEEHVLNTNSQAYHQKPVLLMHVLIILVIVGLHAGRPLILSRSYRTGNNTNLAIYIGPGDVQTGAGRLLPTNFGPCLSKQGCPHYLVTCENGLTGISPKCLQLTVKKRRHLTSKCVFDAQCSAQTRNRWGYLSHNPEKKDTFEHKVRN